MLLLCALIVGSGSVWAEDPTVAVNDVLWTEPFKGTNASTTFSATSSWGSYINPTTFVSADKSTLVYSSSVAMLSSASGANMNGAHVWLNKNNTGYIQVSNIPLYNTTKVKVSWAQGGSSKVSIAYQFDGSGDFKDLSSNSSASPKYESAELNVSGHTTISLQFHRTSTTTNVRIDDLTLTVTEIASSTPSSNATFESAEPSIEMPGQMTYTQTATTADGYTGIVTYSIGSTNTAIATINSTTGVVSPKKAGKVNVIATAPAITGYLASSTSYTLTITDTRTAAGLSYAVKNYEIALEDDSFEAPELLNPNNLTGITYSSSNEEVAVVDENTGELVYNDEETGTATITATYEGNETYKYATASYTITIYDPTVKGSKYNPYTVGDVIDGTATGSGIYVKGFIVGEYVSNTTDPKTSSFTGNSNFALSASFSSSPAVANCIPIELPSSPSSLRSNWGLLSNPSVICYEVLICGNCTTYFSVNGIKGTSEVSAISIPVSTASGQTYGTLVSNYNLDFSEASGITAYKVTDIEGGIIQTATLTEVPSGTPILIETTSAGATINVPVAASTPATITGNMLKAGANSIVSDEEYYRYVLAVQGGVTGFYKLTSATNVPQNRAYLELTAAQAASAPSMIRIVGEENNATNIENIQFDEKAVKFMENGQIYILREGVVYDALGRIVK